MVTSATNWPWSSHRYRVTTGTGSAGACPTNNNCSLEQEGDSPTNKKGLSSGSVPGILSPLPIELPQPWTEYVDTPMTAVELSKMQVVRK